MADGNVRWISLAESHLLERMTLIGLVVDSKIGRQESGGGVTIITPKSSL